APSPALLPSTTLFRSDPSPDTFLIRRGRSAPSKPWYARLLHDLAWMPVAEAHLPPMTGCLHMIKIFGLPGNTTPYYLAFTTRLRSEQHTSELQSPYDL